ncbi:cellulose binding domain-containing protein [Streptomyces sp. NBC_01190]|uniref:cellulose binding domain-containing protein n=1 Tax=Streptomyces sp. NBC_01190 TaxID=2903767 RepID=UPI00386BED3E|nr:cellulose binding domain-containing protein [Streptomyces sp. NBC_01190]
MTATDLGCNATIPSGGTTGFGFKGTRTGTTAPTTRVRPVLLPIATGGLRQAGT